VGFLKTSLHQLANDARFTAGLLRKKPFSCLVQVTNRCNMECSFCDFWPNPAPKKDELTAAEMRRIAKELSELGTFVVSIEGGEPFVRKDLVEIVRAFGERHIPALYTNGWFVTPENAKALFDAGLTQVHVSIDYPDAARHDAKRRLAGTSDRAWRAVDILRDAAPRGGKQVGVMSVLMQDTMDGMERLFEMSASHGVGHQVTLLSTSGFRRKSTVDALPLRSASVSATMTALWEKYPHVRFFKDYFARMDAFLEGGAMPTCRAGAQSFNIDHVGNVSPCIEKIDESVGNVREHSLATLHARLADKSAEIARCQSCWTACRGFQQSMADGGTARGWLDLGSRMRTQ
jgi:MoaA/NifB/PqqE/SkfB family radical SAM enzyme